jgi:hypothetical protein
VVNLPIYENGQFWVCKARRGYEVYKTGITCSTRCAIVGYEGSEGLRRATDEADRRASALAEADGNTRGAKSDEGLNQEEVR